MEKKDNRTWEETMEETQSLIRGLREDVGRYLERCDIAQKQNEEMMELISQMRKNSEEAQKIRAEFSGTEDDLDENRCSE